MNETTVSEPVACLGGGGTKPVFKLRFLSSHAQRFYTNQGITQCCQIADNSTIFGSKVAEKITFLRRKLIAVPL